MGFQAESATNIDPNVLQPLWRVFPVFPKGRIKGQPARVWKQDLGHSDVPTFCLRSHCGGENRRGEWIVWISIIWSVFPKPQTSTLNLYPKPHGQETPALFSTKKTSLENFQLVNNALGAWCWNSCTPWGYWKRKWKLL